MNQVQTPSEASVAKFVWASAEELRQHVAKSNAVVRFFAKVIESIVNRTSETARTKEGRTMVFQKVFQKKPIAIGFKIGMLAASDR